MNQKEPAVNTLNVQKLPTKITPKLNDVNQKQQLQKSKTVQVLPKTPPKLVQKSASYVTSPTKMDMIYPQHNLVQQKQQESIRHQPYPPRPFQPTTATVPNQQQTVHNQVKGYGIKQAISRPVVPPGQRMQNNPKP